MLLEQLHYSVYIIHSIYITLKFPSGMQTIKLNELTCTK